MRSVLILVLISLLNLSSVDLLAGDKAFAVDDFTVETGRQETVFDWSSQKCEENDIPDMPTRAFVDDGGKVQLIATHYIARRNIGDNLNNISHSCDVIFTSDKNSVPRMYDDFEWLHSFYTLDGKTIYALIHTEYHGWDHNNCNSSGANLFNCWWNSINLASSIDGGRTYFHTLAPSHNIVNSPLDYDPNNTQGNIGFFEPSNIIFKDGYYYSLMTQHNPPDAGTCLMRTNNLSDSKSWRLWDGNGFNAQGDRARCVVLSGWPPHSFVSYNTYLGKYIAITSWWTNTAWYSLSDDLIHWTDRKVFLQNINPGIGTGPGPYVSLLQPGDPTRNFELTGRSPWLYYTRCVGKEGQEGCGGSMNRNLEKVRIRFSKQGEENYYELLDLRMNEKRGNKTLDSSFYGNDGILSGGVSFQFENDKNFLHFDGRGQVSVNHNSSLNAEKAITIEAVVRVNNSPPAGQFWTIVKKDGGPGQRNFGLWIVPETGRLLFSLTKNGNVIGSLGNTSVADGKWHHVLISYTDQSGYASYYVDGKRDAVTFLGAQLAEGQNTANVIVGDEGFTGDIDFMTIRNYDLAATKPPAPDIISPRNGETVFGSTHNFSWQSTADYYNVDRYALEIKQPGENPCHIDGNSTACIFLDDHLVASTSQEVDGLVAGNGYVWAVLAHNSSGWSERVLNYFDVPLSFWDGWNRIIWPNITDKTMADLPSGCTVEDETRNLWFYPFAKNFLPFPTPFIPTKTYFFSCR